MFPYMTVQENLADGRLRPHGRGRRGRRPRPRARPLPDAGRAAPPGRGHAVRRRAADARHRPRPHGAAPAHPVRRALARPGPHRRRGDVPDHRRHPARGDHGAHGRAERLHGAPAGDRAYVMETGRIALRGTGARSLLRQRAREAGIPGRRELGPRSRTGRGQETPDMGAKYFGAAVRRKEDPGSCAARAASWTTSSCPACCTPPSCGARTPTRGSAASAPRRPRAPARRRAASSRFADVARWMKPLPLFGAVPPGLAARVTVTMKQAPQLAICPRRGAPRGRDRGHGRGREPRRGRGRLPSWSRWTTSRCPAVPTWWRPREPGAPPALPGVGRQRRGVASRRASATSTRPSARPTCAVRERFDDPALRGHADRDARRGRAVGPARRHAHHLEHHPGRPLRPAGAGGRPRAAPPTRCA